MRKNEGSSVKKVVVDSGKYATKAIARDANMEIEKLYFETKMDKTEETSTNAERSYAIEYNGDRFILGSNAKANDFTTTKEKDLHRNAIYTAIHQLVNDGDTVSLVVGCPLSVFTVKASRESYENYLQEAENVEIIVNGVRKQFKIQSVSAFPEGSGYIFKNLEKYVDKIVAVVDIGGLNTNGCIYEGVDMLPKTDFTSNQGANVLRSNLRTHLNKTFGSNLSHKQVEMAIKERKIKIDEVKSKKVIDDFLLQHVMELKEEMIEKQWDVDSLEYIFLGGGSILLQEEIYAIFGDDITISENAIWDNAEGFAEIIDL